MPNKRKITPEAVLKVLPGTFGNKSAIARRLGVSRKSIDRMIEENTEIAEAFEQERETAIDFAESRLMQGINSGDPESIRFFLRTIGRRRGYSERMEVSGENGGAIVVKIDADDARG